MPLPTIPFATWWSRTRAAFRVAFDGKPVGLKQFLGQSARAVSLVVWGLQGSIEDLDKDIVPSARSSDDILTAWAVLLALPNGDGAGGVGRLVPTTASGGAATFTGSFGTSFADGTIATAEDGVTEVAVSGTVAIPGSSGLGSIAGVLVAVTAGSIGNLPAGTICTWQNPPLGADPTFTLTTGLTNGIDTESNADVWTRIQQRLQLPPRGGNTTDIDEWSVAVAGVVGVFSYPRRSGTGTVDVVITVGGASTGTGTSRVPSDALIAKVQAAIDAVRVPGAEAIEAMAPVESDTGSLVRVRVVPNGNANAWDWGSDVVWTGTPFTVAGYTGGASPTLTLSATAPASLQAAITAYIANTGQAPRLQVLSAGGNPLNPPVSVIAIDGTELILSLATLPEGWTAPTNGDTVYPYGPAVATIATNLLTYVDSIGPSRASGYADDLITWQDAIAVNQLVRIAEDAVDANGVVLVTEVLAGGATIGGSATDVEAEDSIPDQAPGILWASHIAVTP